MIICDKMIVNEFLCGVNVKLLVV